MGRRGVATVAGVVAVMMIALALLDSPRQIVFIGVVDGLSYGLLALGVVLIYRTSRVINFAVGSMAPKMEAAFDYLAAIDGETIICLPADLVEAIDGRAGTHIRRTA